MTSSARLLVVLALFTWLPINASAQPVEDAEGMHAYMVLLAFTEQGLVNVGDLPTIEEARDIVRSFGGEVKAFYGVLGSTIADAMFVIDAPNDETVAAMVLSIASRGNVRTETHRLFTEEEYQGIVTLIP